MNLLRRCLRTSTSLRTRVAIAAALSAAAVIAMFAVGTSVLVARNDSAQLDRRLDTIIESSVYAGSIRDPRRGPAITARSPTTGEVVFQRGLPLPPLPEGTTNLILDGIEFRVRTVQVESAGGVLLSVGIRVDTLILDEGAIPMYLAAGVGAVLLAAVMGWVFAGPAVKPLRRLTDHTRRLREGTDALPPVQGIREAEDLSDAMSDMLTRLAAAQSALTDSLQTAQDFAANAAHELRTPLTAMRADLDTLRIHDLPTEERAEVVADLSRAQRRVEAIITALSQLASGQLAKVEDREPVDVADLLERVKQENVRSLTPVEIEVRADDAGTVDGWPGGLRLAVDNLVRNAIAHGRATKIVLTARRVDDTLAIIVDDNGCGLPEHEHRSVLGRFTRGSTAATAGSGLGLALVAQQAALHRGTIELADGPRGGVRATLTVSTVA